MKKIVEREITVCDCCGEEAPFAAYHCGSCGTEHCYKCADREGVRYPHAVHVSGSGDGYYCRDCDKKLLGKDELHNAYRAIKALRDESEGYWSEFKKRQAKAEKAVEDAAEARKS